MAKTIAEINDKIKAGKAVVFTAEEIIEFVKEKGVSKAAEEVDVVTTGTFGPMCSSGAYFNIGHSKPRIKLGGGRVYLNDVAAYAGLAAVDVFIGATALPDDDPRNRVFPGNLKYPTFLGIDLTSTEAEPSACVGLDSKSQVVYLGFLTKNTDIIALTDFYLPQVIALDAPSSLPLGLCCLEEDCPYQPELLRESRQCDQELRQQGIPCYPTSKKTFIEALIYRGIVLKTNLGHEVKQTSQVIEVYPFASKAGLFERNVTRKTTKQGMSSLRDRLGQILPSLKPYLRMLNNDLCDAAVAAYTGLLHHPNRAEALCDRTEGLIFIPD